MFFFLFLRQPPRSTRTDTLFPYTTLFRSVFAGVERHAFDREIGARVGIILAPHGGVGRCAAREIERADLGADCVHVEHVHGALLPSVSASNARQIARGPMLG